MSAYLVTKEHVDALVAAALLDPVYGGMRWTDSKGVRRQESNETANDTGKMLWTECHTSVRTRYSSGPLPGPTCFKVEHLASYKAGPMPAGLDIVALLKLIDCYEYQSCEHDGWDTSDAHLYCSALREHLVRLLPGYEAAPWGL